MNQDYEIEEKGGNSVQETHITSLGQALEILKNNLEGKEINKQELEKVKKLEIDTIPCSIQTLRKVRTEAKELCKTYKGEKGITDLREFIKKLARPRTRAMNSASEGESENEDPTIVYRAIRDDEVTDLEQGKGIVPKGKDTKISISDHITYLGNNKNNEEKRKDSPWVSATRSIKVAAAWASESSSKKFIKIRIPEACLEERNLVHQEKGCKRIYDLTNDEDIQVTLSRGSDQTTAKSSQEVVIYGEIPREQILDIYIADTVSEILYKRFKSITNQADLSRVGIYSLVKTRKASSETPKPRIIVREYQDDEKSKEEELDKLNTDFQKLNLSDEDATEYKKELNAILQESNIDINNVNIDDYTSLHWAAYNGHDRLLKFLLEKDNNPNKVDRDGYTPLHRAVYGGHKAIVNRLLDAKLILISLEPENRLCLCIGLH